jgi:hypothetical protein
MLLAKIKKFPYCATKIPLYNTVNITKIIANIKDLNADNATEKHRSLFTAHSVKIY